MVVDFLQVVKANVAAGAHNRNTSESWVNASAV
jgi:hypothetical protein